jgi:uncharacterized protein with beta-barrel porin domain
MDWSRSRRVSQMMPRPSSVYGGVIGVDRRIRPDWLVGVFAGGGSSTLNVDLSSQKLNTDYFSGGAYSRFEWASQFFDTTLAGRGPQQPLDAAVAEQHFRRPGERHREL